MKTDITDTEGPPKPRYWYVCASGQQYGPYPESDMAAWLRQGGPADGAVFSCGGSWMTFTEARQLIFGSQSASKGVSEALPAPEPATTAQPAPSMTDSEAELPVIAIRDRIVVIGRRASGKSIYLATLYKQLWRARDGLTMKALSGQVHKQLIDMAEHLQKGEWLPATFKDTLVQMELEVTYKGRTQILVGLDYSGEVFSDAFVNDDEESAQAKTLLSHLDRAAAVMLLMDPAVAVSGHADEFVDDDFGIVQAIRYIRDSPGGEQVPITLVLTKWDQNTRLFKGLDEAREFVAAHYPPLVRTLRKCRFFVTSAVQAKKDDQGHPKPKPDSVPVNVVEPLKYCLNVLDEQEEQERRQAAEQAKQEAIGSQILAEERAIRRANLTWLAVGAAIVIAGICITALIVYFKL